VPLITIAILFVTVLVVDDETVVGKVKVVVTASTGLIVVPPEVAPVKTNDPIIYPLLSLILK
jgi:hypothetical protein